MQDAAPDDVGAVDSALPPPDCVLAESSTPGPVLRSDERGQAQVGVRELTPCTRRYQLETTAELRDTTRPKLRTIEEGAADPILRSGSALLDAVYALAVAEAREASVASIRDGAFDNGAPLVCPAPGCFETGASWHYVWTRDTAYAVELALGDLDPERARASLELKLSPRRDGSDEQVVQDTGSGGSYPISSDRVVWALGARAVLANLSGSARDTFRDRAYAALAHTAAHDRAVIYDAADGLYRGETSFLDWRQQSYAPWTAADTVQIGMSIALSTNVLHVSALRLLAELATERGEASEATRYTSEADALSDAIRARFLATPLWPSFVPGTLDSAPAGRYDALAIALVILENVATPSEAAALLASYPQLAHGPPVIWPQDQDAPIYHNRAVWPFVTAYLVRAGAQVRNDALVSKNILGLTTDAALQLSHVENLELVSGRPFVDDGPRSGPVVSSLRQLWSLAGYLSVIERVIFGRQNTSAGLLIQPYLPKALRAELFADARSIGLSRLQYRGQRIDLQLVLPPPSADINGAYALGTVRLNGAPVGSGPLPESALSARNLIEVELLDTPEAAATIHSITVSDPTALYGPRTPSLTGLGIMGGQIHMDVSTAGESRAAIELQIFRDGVSIASGLPGSTTSFSDPSSTAASASHCYAVESQYLSSGNRSHRSVASCWWGVANDRITSFDANAFVANGGSLVFNHGRWHYQDWGDPGHTLVVPSFSAASTGPHLLQVTAGNGAGPIDTGITCGVKRLRVFDNAGGAAVAEGYLLMPQLGSWDDWRGSSFVRADLIAGHAYRILIDDDRFAVNMSSFAHFSHYTGGLGGASGRYDRVNIAELKVLALQP